jgi:putative ABC transport system permease protein
VERDDEIVLGPRLAAMKGLAVGDAIMLSDRRFRVVGVGHVRGAGFPGFSAVYLSYDNLAAMSGTDEIAVGAIDTLDPTTTSEQIAGIRRLDVYSRDEVVAMGENLASADQVLYNVFSVLGLLIAALFVGNVLTMSVSERRSEFATMRAIGIRRGSIMILVMTEALVIALAAYLVGTVAGVLLTKMIDALYASYLGGLSIFSVVDYSVFVRVFAVDLLLGLIAGFLPARAVLRIQPVEALREA